MNELIIYYGTSKIGRITNLVIGAYLLLFCSYFTIVEVLAKRYQELFFISLVGVLLAFILVLLNTVFASKPIMKVNNEHIYANIPNMKEKNLIISWDGISKVNIGVSYVILFLSNQSTQQNIDLGSLTYNDLKSMKSKIIEISEYKNIPYQND